MSLICSKVLKMVRLYDLWKIMLIMLIGTFSPSECQSYGIAPDVETASDKYKRRFASKTGKWFLDEQSSGLLSMLDRRGSVSILDVGGGHGQYTEQLIKNGYSVTVMGSSIEAKTQVRQLIDNDCCRYIVGDLCRFPFDNKSFDVVISFRLMAHLEGWENFIAESCRVAKNAVIVDFPVTLSLNITYPLFFKFKRKLEGNSTRPFKVFDERKVVESFHQAGFSPTARYKQYFFPMVFHRALNSSAMSKYIEKTCRSLTLTDRFGSPVILRVEPNYTMQNKFSTKA